jgi:hypothetical protein
MGKIRFRALFKIYSFKNTLLNTEMSALHHHGLKKKEINCALEDGNISINL